MRGISKTNLLQVVAGFATASVLSASSAFAAVSYPGPYVGADVTYTDLVEASGDPINDPEPLYGEPEIAVGNKLDFDPSANAFASYSPPPDTTDGSLTFLVTSNNNTVIPSFQVMEGGDYQFLGSVTGGEAVAAGLFVRILDANTDALIAQATDAFVDTFDNVPIEGGFWTNSVNIDLSQYGLTEFKVEIDNALQASGSGSASAFIRKKEFMVDVPEPGMAALFFAGSTLMLSARRRSA